MLSPAWADPVEACLDPQVLREQLRPVLAPRGEVVAVRVVHAHRSTSRRRQPHPLTAVYEVDLHDAPGAALRQVRCYAKLYRDGASAQALPQPGALHVAALDLVLWPWPADPGLPQLAALLDTRAAQSWWGAPAQAVHALRHAPENRAVLRYTHADGRTLYAKTFADDRGADVQRRFAWFWERSQRDAGAPRVARPLHYDAATRTLWQEAATGTPLAAAMDAQGTAWAQPLARALATLHDAPAALGGRERLDREHWLTEAQRRGRKIARALPALAPSADATVAAIERAAARLPAHREVPVHADFHHGQAWIDGERAVLFDFDEVALGDPMQDLASFVVRLPASAGPDAATRWLAAYAAVAPAHFDTARLAWHLALQQLMQASRAFVFQVDHWRAEVARRLERAQALAAQADTGARP
jgi:Phosphotransferase enzyme family